jgi:acid phosphatase type 7
MLGSVVPLPRTAKVSAFVLPALLLVAPGGAGAAEIRKGPYLQALGQKGVTIKFELSTPEIGTVDVSGPGEFRVSRASDSQKKFHAIRLDGLSPQTTYKYQVKAAGVETKPVEFTTAPADDRPFKFVVYGDSRSDAAAHAAVVRAIESAPAEFFLHTGDMIYAGDNEGEWQEFFSIESKLLASRCAFIAVGNHELTTPDPAGQITFLRYFAAMDEDGRERPHLYGSFRWSNTRFFLLNAMDTWTGDEKEWLKAELSAALTEPGVLHRVVALHHGPFSSGRHGGNVRLHANGIVPILRDNKVDLIVAGHDHVYERGEGQGLKYIVSGGAGAPLYSKEKRAPETQYFEAVHHFLEVSVDGDKMTVLARRAIGSVIEKCSFRGTESWSCTSGEEKSTPASAPAASPQTASSACACSAPGSAPRGLGGAAGFFALAALGGLGARLRKAAARET